jgi:tetratricopeptide (TPR) repeat protein
MKPALLLVFFLHVPDVFCQVTNVDSIASLIDHAKTVREKIEILNNAASFTVNADLKRSIDYAEQARTLALESRDDIGLAHAALNSGKYYTRVGMYERAMENYILSLKISEEKGDESLRGLVYKVMGNNYYFKHDYKMAKHYYKRALAINEKFNDEETAADLLNNIALILIESRELDSALNYLNAAAGRYEKLKKPGKLANTFLNIGLVKAENKQYDEAISYYKKALALDQSVGLTLQEGAALNNIASALIKLGKTQEAEVYLKKALAIGEKENFRSLLVNVYHNLAVVGKGSKNFPLIMEQLLRMKDSLHSEQNSKLMEELRTKYESDQKEKENQHLLVQSEANEKQLMFARYLIFFIALFAVVVTSLAIVYYRLLVQNRKAKHELSVLNIQIQQQARDLKIANDEIAVINENLHGIVVEKSSTIDEQNERLVEYTFHNSHRVRGPLTRILGLIDVVKIGAIQQEEMGFVLNEIDKASNELDHVLKEINTTLNNQANDSSEKSV